jgi:hypothetical protein
MTELGKFCAGHGLRSARRGLAFAWSLLGLGVSGHGLG